MTDYTDILRRIDRYFTEGVDADGFDTDIDRIALLLEDKVFGRILHEETEYLEPPRNPEGRPICPVCGSIMYKHSSYSLYKKDFDGNKVAAHKVQRYRCTEETCRHVFSEKPVKTAATASKAEKRVWHAFIKAELQHATVRQEAELCGISKTTAWHMRMRLHEVIKQNKLDFIVYPNEECWIDEKYEYDSYSGNHKKIDLSSTVRDSYGRGRKHSGGKRERGFGDADNICVVWAVTRGGKMMAEMCNRGSMRAEQGKSILNDRFYPNATVHTDQLATYKGTFENTGVDLVQTNAQDHKMNPVGTVHNNFKKYLQPFRGVATRRLDGYIQFFVWMSQALSSARVMKGDVETTERLVARTGISNTYQDIDEAPIPFSTWWETHAGVTMRWDKRIAEIEAKMKNLQRKIDHHYNNLDGLRRNINKLAAKKVELEAEKRVDLVEKGFAAA